LAEVVPPAHRNLVFAMNRCFEGAPAAFGAPMVGWIAEQWFGYHGLATTSEGCSGHDCQEDSGMSDMQKAEALGSAMFVMTAVPWGLCALVFACLHLTYPRDRRRVAARRAPAPPPSSPEPRELEDMAGIAAGPSTLRRPRSKNSSPDE